LVCGPSRSLLRNREAECDGGCRATRRAGPRGITGRRPECRSKPMVGGRPAWTPYTAPGSKPCKPRDPGRCPPAPQRNVRCCGCPTSVTYRWSGVAFDHRCSDRCRRCPACFVHRCGDGRGCGLVPPAGFKGSAARDGRVPEALARRGTSPRCRRFPLTLGLNLLLSPDHEFVCTRSGFPSQSFRSRFSIRQGGSSGGRTFVGLATAPLEKWTESSNTPAAIQRSCSTRSCGRMLFGTKAGSSSAGRAPTSKAHSGPWRGDFALPSREAAALNANGTPRARLRSPPHQILS
jgi:hypothetical protein